MCGLQGCILGRAVHMGLPLTHCIQVNLREGYQSRSGGELKVDRSAFITCLYYESQLIETQKSRYHACLHNRNSLLRSPGLNFHIALRGGIETQCYQPSLSYTDIRSPMGLECWGKSRVNVDKQPSSADLKCPWVNNICRPESLNFFSLFSL